MRRKSLTLLELIVSILLIGMLVLGIFGILNTVGGFYASSEGQSVVLNELSYLLDHIDRNVYLSVGWLGNHAVVVNQPTPNRFIITINQFNNPQDPDFTNLQTVIYDFDIGNNDVSFVNPAGVRQVLSRRLIQSPAQLNIDFDASVGILTIDNLALRLDPSRATDQRLNPTVEVTAQEFSSWMQSIR